MKINVQQSDWLYQESDKKLPSSNRAAGELWKSCLIGLIIGVLSAGLVLAVITIPKMVKQLQQQPHRLLVQPPLRPPVQPPLRLLVQQLQQRRQQQPLQRRPPQRLRRLRRLRQRRLRRRRRQQQP
ncbi:unnamed protein product [Rotaria magnacalcarata]|uniref:Uncharacterized protein n=1 Tax=Rotaria magnacalcarata TaxID=392030 RepID=A0A818XH04_9BILA|nr:unnamed protein product [Rotaria magnacalcarata]CAF4025288.1 unnamed protein product [Rotaria magnacalcarata]